MKNDITYEYRKIVNRPDLTVSNIEIGECTYNVLKKELKKIVNGRVYHTTDTNQFFYDYNNKRYELNLFGTESVDDMVERAITDADIDQKVSDSVAKKMAELDPSINVNYISVYSNIESAYRTVIYNVEPKESIINETTDGGVTYVGEHIEGFGNNKTIKCAILDFVFTGKENLTIGAMVGINVPTSYNVKIMHYDISNSIWKSYTLSKSDAINGRVEYLRAPEDGKSLLTGPLNLKVIIYK